MAPTLFAALASFLIKSAVLLGSTLFVHVALGRRLSANLRAWLIIAGFAVLPMLALSSLARPAAASNPSFPSPRAVASPDTAGRAHTAVAMPYPMAQRDEAADPFISVPNIVARSIVLAWLAGTALCAASLIGAHLRSWAALGRLPRCKDAGWLLALESAKRELGIAHRVNLVVDARRLPYSSGVLRASISVPSSETTWNRGRKDAAMLHEGAHLRRRDAALMLLARILASLVWCIPFTPLLLSRLSFDREEACDDLAVLHGADPIEFADLMLELAAAPGTHSLPCAQGIGKGRDIQKRIDMILRHAIHGKRPRRGAIAAAAISFFLFAVGSAIIPSVFADDLPKGRIPASTPGSVELNSCGEDDVVSQAAFDLSSLPLASPLGDGRWKVTTGFGASVNPLTGAPMVHRGIDLTDYRSGDSVRATMSGIVAESGFDASYGYFVLVENGSVSTFYAHLTKAGSAKGASLSVGDTLGFVGKTGLATGPHLHYEIRFGGRWVDPAPLLAAGGRVFLR